MSIKKKTWAQFQKVSTPPQPQTSCLISASHRHHHPPPPVPGDSVYIKRFICLFQHRVPCRCDQRPNILKPPSVSRTACRAVRVARRCIYYCVFKWSGVMRHVDEVIAAGLNRDFWAELVAFWFGSKSKKVKWGGKEDISTVGCYQLALPASQDLWEVISDWWEFFKSFLLFEKLKWGQIAECQMFNWW